MSIRRCSHRGSTHSETTAFTLLLVAPWALAGILFLAGFTSSSSESLTRAVIFVHTFPFGVPTECRELITRFLGGSGASSSSLDTTVVGFFRLTPFVGAVRGGSTAGDEDLGGEDLGGTDLMYIGNRVSTIKKGSREKVRTRYLRRLECKGRQHKVRRIGVKKQTDFYCERMLSTLLSELLSNVHG